MTKQSRLLAVLAVIQIVFMSAFAQKCEENPFFTGAYFDKDDESFLFKTLIGSGKYGSVFTINWAGEDGKEQIVTTAAVKKSHKLVDESIAFETMIIHALQTTFKDRARTPKLYGCFVGPDFADYLVTDFIPITIQPQIRAVDKKLVVNPFYIEFFTLPPCLRIKFYSQLAEGLSQLHKIGYAHCDVKFDNFLLDEVSANGKAYLIDFGVAQKLPDPGMASHSSSICNQQSDLYNLAETIYQLENSYDSVTKTYVNPNLIDLRKMPPTTTVSDLIKNADWMVRRGINFESAHGNFGSIIIRMIAKHPGDALDAATVAEAFWNMSDSGACQSEAHLII